MLRILRNDGAEMNAEAIIPIGCEGEVVISLSNDLPMLEAVSFFEGENAFKAIDERYGNGVCSTYTGYDIILSASRGYDGRVRIILKKSAEFAQE